MDDGSQGSKAGPGRSLQFGCRTGSCRTCPESWTGTPVQMRLDTEEDVGGLAVGRGCVQHEKGN